MCNVLEKVEMYDDILMCGYILAVVLTGVYFVRQRLREEEQRIDKLLEGLSDDKKENR